MCGKRGKPADSRQCSITPGSRFTGLLHIYGCIYILDIYGIAQFTWYGFLATAWLDRLRCTNLLLLVPTTSAVLLAADLPILTLNYSALEFSIFKLLARPEKVIKEREADLCRECEVALCRRVARCLRKACTLFKRRHGDDRVEISPRYGQAHGRKREVWSTRTKNTASRTRTLCVDDSQDVIPRAE